MTKEEIDKIIIEDWDRLTLIVKSYISNAKYKCDLDIMTCSYETILENKNRYLYNKDVISHFLKLCKDSTIFYNSKYQYNLRKNKEILILDSETYEGDRYSSLLEDDSEEYDNYLDVYDSYIYEYKKSCKREEQLAIEAYLSGYNTVSKFAEYTKLPQTTAFLYLQKIKLKLKYMKIKDEYKGLKITRRVLGLGEITLDCDKEYTENQLKNLYKYFSDIIDDLDTQKDKVIEQPKKKKIISKSKSKVTKNKK